MVSFGMGEGPHFAQVDEGYRLKQKNIVGSKGAEMNTVQWTVRIEGTESKSNAQVGAPIGAGNDVHLILRSEPLAGSGAAPRLSSNDILAVSSADKPDLQIK